MTETMQAVVCHGPRDYRIDPEHASFGFLAKEVFNDAILERVKRDHRDARARFESRSQDT